MRIQKEIENVERVKDKMATMPLTFEDAIEFHKQVVDRIEKERKEANKELGIGDIEEEGFTGASKEPKKVSTPELKKMKLSESLFESALNEGYFITDFNKLKRILKKIADDPNSIVIDPDYTTIDVINGKNCYCIYANGIEDHIIESIAQDLEDDFYTDVEVFDIETNSNNIDFNKLPKAAKEDLEKYGEEELNNSYYKCIALKYSINESLNEDNTDRYVLKIRKRGNDGYLFQGCGGRSLVRSDSKNIDVFTKEEAEKELLTYKNPRRKNIEIVKYNEPFNEVFSIEKTRERHEILEKLEDLFYNYDVSEEEFLEHLLDYIDGETVKRAVDEYIDLYDLDESLNESVSLDMQDELEKFLRDNKIKGSTFLYYLIEYLDDDIIENVMDEISDDMRFEKNDIIDDDKLSYWNESLHEAKREKRDIFDLVMDELMGIGNIKHWKVPYEEIKPGDRYDDEQVGVSPDDEIAVYGETEDELALAKRIADLWEVPYKVVTHENAPEGGKFELRIAAPFNESLRESKYLREAINAPFIKIFKKTGDIELTEDGWDFPIDEIDYLLDEHAGESFALAYDEDGDYRLFEIDDYFNESYTPRLKEEIGGSVYDDYDDEEEEDEKPVTTADAAVVEQEREEQEREQAEKERKQKELEQRVNQQREEDRRAEEESAREENERKIAAKEQKAREYYWEKREADKKAAAEKRKAEYDKKRKMARRMKTLDKVAKTPVDLANSVLKGARKSGLHIG